MIICILRRIYFLYPFRGSLSAKWPLLFILFIFYNKPNSSYHQCVGCYELNWNFIGNPNRFVVAGRGMISFINTVLLAGQSWNNRITRLSNWPLAGVPTSPIFGQIAEWNAAFLYEYTLQIQRRIAFILLQLIWLSLFFFLAHSLSLYINRFGLFIFVSYLVK